jgi:hypothetical protein
MLLGERVPAWAMPLWLAMVALERWLPWARTAALFLAARGPGRARLSRLTHPARSRSPGGERSRTAGEGGLGRPQGPPGAGGRADDPGLWTVTVVALGFLGPAGEPAVATEIRQA